MAVTLPPLLSTTFSKKQLVFRRFAGNSMLKIQYDASHASKARLNDFTGTRSSSGKLSSTTLNSSTPVMQGVGDFTCAHQKLL
jgi:hypothetical protein